MKISDYPATAYPSPSDSFIFDGAAGTKRISLDDLSYAVSGGFATERVRRTSAKNTTYRGKSLGTSLTPQQLTEIRSGNFANLWLGDFWTINGRVWRIADFDYWYGTGDPVSSARHIVIIPDSSLYDAKWNPTASTVGGYVNSNIYTSGLNTAKTLINGAFGEANILSHYDTLVNSVTESGRIMGRINVQTKIDLPNENMIWGAPINKLMNNATPTLWTQEVCNRQLSLFHVAPSLRSWGAPYWLRDSTGLTTAATVEKTGVAGISDCSVVLGVRPVFAIG